MNRGDIAEPPAAADALQRPLRARFQARLSRSVDMTADVKSCQQILEVFIMFFTLVQWKSRRQPEATVDPAAIRGLGTT
jgi:hypothetical protein